ncbi:MAG: PD-(D/E)XK motif protein [Bacteroidales bacterium]
MMKIDKLWEELESDKSVSHGLLLRRYSGSVLPDVFIAMKLPEKFRCIAASLSNSASIDLSGYSNLQDISLEIIPDESRAEKNILLFKLLSNQHLDIFSVLCEDLIANILSLTNEYLLVKELLNRFEKWKSLFEKASAQGLSSEEQRGLFGELFFLRKALHITTDFIRVINSWVGPEKQIRDFQFGNCCVEVKTSHGNNHQKVQISNERQLDITNLKNLFLYHLSLEVRQKSGESLNEMVKSVSQLLNSDFVALNRFKNKLFEVGYFDHHQDLYESTGYFIRKDNFYKVESNFPRIEEADLRDGVGDVKYSIVISQCSDFLVEELFVFESLLL